jgi:hypothetical protein
MINYESIIYGKAGVVIALPGTEDPSYANYQA